MFMLMLMLYVYNVDYRGEGGVHLYILQQYKHMLPAQYKAYSRRACYFCYCYGISNFNFNFNFEFNFKLMNLSEM